MTFQLSALPASTFAPLFALSDEALAAKRCKRVVATSSPGFPCRVSLRDAEVGETLMLVNVEHLPVDSPFRSTHAVYVRQGADEARPVAGEIPAFLRSRLLSVRAFDAEGMMTDADVAPGTEVEALIERMLVPQAVKYLHVHFARPGCYAARVDRARTARG